MTKTYTVLNAHGEVQERNCDVAEAAELVLRYDGHEFEILPEEDGGGYALWTSLTSRNSGHYKGLRKSRIFSLKDNATEAGEDIYRQVIVNADWWSGCCVMTDDDYEAMMAEASAE